MLNYVCDVYKIQNSGFRVNIIMSTNIADMTVNEPSARESSLGETVIKTIFVIHLEMRNTDMNQRIITRSI